MSFVPFVRGELLTADKLNDAFYAVDAGIEEVSLEGWCGANGVSYDPNAIQTAVSAALAATVPGASNSLAGKAIKLPPQTVVASGPISLPAGMRYARLSGFYGATSLRRSFDGDLFQNGTGGSAQRSLARDDLTARPTGLWLDSLDIGTTYTVASGAYGDQGSHGGGPTGNLIAGFVADEVYLTRCTLTGVANGRFVGRAGDRWFLDDVVFRASADDVGAGGDRVLFGTGHIGRRIRGRSGDDFLQVVISVVDNLPIGTVVWEDCEGISTQARGMNVALGEQGKEDRSSNYYSYIEKVTYRRCRVRGENTDIKVNVEAEGWIGDVVFEDVDILPLSYGLAVPTTSREMSVLLNVIRFYDADPTLPSIRSITFRRFRTKQPGKAHFICSVSNGEAREYTIASGSRASNVVTLTLPSAHGKTVGDPTATVTVSAATPTFFSGGPFTITATPTPTSLQYAQTGINTNLTRGKAAIPYSTAEAAAAAARQAFGSLVFEDCETGPSVNWLAAGQNADGSSRGNNTNTAAAAKDDDAWQLTGYEHCEIVRPRVACVTGQDGITFGRAQTAKRAKISGKGLIAGIKVAPLYPAGVAWAAQTVVDAVAGVRRFNTTGGSCDVFDIKIDPAAGTPDAEAKPILISNDAVTFATDNLVDLVDVSAWPTTHTYVGGPSSNFTVRTLRYPAGWAAPAASTLEANIVSSGIASNTITWNGTDEHLRITGTTAATIHTITPSVTPTTPRRLTVSVIGANTITMQARSGSTGNLYMSSSPALTQNQSIELVWDVTSGGFRRIGFQ